MASNFSYIKDAADRVIASRLRAATPKTGAAGVLEQVRKSVEARLQKDYALEPQRDDALDLAIFTAAVLNALDDADTTYEDHVAGCAITYVRAAIARALEAHAKKS